ncbi:MAG: Hpt domain-containing protein [Beijerinckiaceae bacterium]
MLAATQAMQFRPTPPLGAACSIEVTMPEPARPIDLIHLARQTLGDRDLETELLGLFDRQAGQILDRLSADLPHVDMKCRADLAHTLKGSASAVGAVRVAKKADIYEAQARAGGGDLKPALAGLRTAIEEARETVAHLLAG